jgi:hypothetical protein
MKDIFSAYQPDILHASYQPDEQLLKEVITDVKTNPDILHQTSPDTEFNDMAVNRYLHEEMKNKQFLTSAYQVGGLVMNVIVKRTFERDDKNLPPIIPQHAQLNRSIDPEITKRLAADESLLDGRIAEFQIMKAEMKAFAQVPLITDEHASLSRQFIAGLVDIANLYDIAVKHPVKNFLKNK